MYRFIMFLMPPELLPVVQITLPLMVTIIAATMGASWVQNKRLDDIIRRIERIEVLLREQGERITRLEERLPPLVHRN